MTLHCTGCGRSRTGCSGCLPELDPPRFCAVCGQRLGVQVTPAGWTARCRTCARREEVATGGHLGDTALARRHLGDRDPRVRATALGALRRAADLRAEELMAAVDDPAPEVRTRAVELAAAVPGDRPPAILPLLDDEDGRVVEAAAWASGERSPAEEGAAARLAAIATGHDDPLCREAAVAALGSLGDPGGRDAVLAATGDRPAVRRRAVLALAAFQGTEVDAALDRARQDRDWQVRQAAADVAPEGGP